MKKIRNNGVKKLNKKPAVIKTENNRAGAIKKLFVAILVFSQLFLIIYLHLSFVVASNLLLLVNLALSLII